MDRHIISQQTAAYVNQAINGLEVENQKIDLKSEWYKLNEAEGINEFLKDSSLYHWIR